MSPLVVVFIAVGLAMDAFAVSVASGCALRCFHVAHALRVAFFFGAFQAIMPVAGWLAGRGFQEAITGADHWVAFAILAGIGGKMIFESFRLKSGAAASCPPARMQAGGQDVGWLLLLALATSIDALAVGVSLSFLDISIVTPAAVIGGITFALCFAGVYVGSRAGHFFENKLEAVGGFILIVIGLKILLEHIR